METVTDKLNMLFVIILCTYLCGCGGSGGSINNSPGLLTGQALLGPLVSADVTLYEYGDFKRSIHSTTTSNASTISEAGIFEIPINLIHDNELYIIEINGGADIDADDDGIVDNTPTVNHGKIRLIAEGRSLKEGNFKVNILTEIVYRKTAYLFAAEYPKQHIITLANKCAAAFLKEDINGDREINLNDLVVWNPVFDKDKIHQNWQFFENLIKYIHNNSQKEIEEKLSHLTCLTWRVIAEADTPGYASGIKIGGNYAYVTDGFEGLQIIDISNNQDPVIVAHVNTPGYAEDVFILNDYAYVADGDSGIQVVNINIIQAPIIVAHIDTGGYAQAITQADSHVADGDAGVQIIDISDPLIPFIIDAINTPGYAEDVFITDFHGRFVV